MNDDPPFLIGELEKWPSKSALARMFRSDGYLITEGKYSLRLDDFDHFEFRELGGDLGPGRVTAESASTEELTAFAQRVSQTLANAEVRHRFEIYSATDELVAYIHHDWPKDW